MTRTTPAHQLVNSSRQVNFSAVHDYVVKLIGPGLDLLTVGTPAWCALDDDDPAKTAAVINGGQHWALHLELRQLALAKASKAIAAAADWTAIAREVHEIDAFRAKNPWAKRVAS